MKKCANVKEVKQEIDSYEKHFTGAPLLIGIDNNTDYAALLGLLEDDFGKQIIKMSEFCAADFPPDPAFQISAVGNAAKAKPVVWIGGIQAKMLYGQQETESFLINLLGSSFSGPVTVLCPFCCSILEGISRSYLKLGYNILVVRTEKRDVPAINVYPKGTPYKGSNTAQGIKSLLQILEEGKYRDSIDLVTSCGIEYLKSSMYPVSEGKTPYQILCQKELGIAANTEERNGTFSQWQKLYAAMQNSENLSALCEKQLCPIQSLSVDFGDYLSADQDARFLCFVCLKAFHSKGGEYLAHCISKATSVDDFESCIYTAILDIDQSDKRFISWNRQRRRMLSTFDENSAMMKDFCDRATIKGKDVLWYLSDETEEERAAIIHALCTYRYSSEELCTILKTVSPQLAAYLELFRFDEFNTKVLESDAYVRGLLTDYFQRYKLQKLTNRQDQDFVVLVEKEAKARSFTKLQARSAIIKKLEKKDIQPYFFDALGAEFLAFIQAKAEEYGMQFECSIGHCNLPSITSKNKEFYSAFPEGSILKEEGLDEIKHHGTKYDFRFTREPLHIFDELAILDRDLRKMSSALAMEKCRRIVIMSDHGASRLAVTYQSENDKIELSEPGQHSGRCCPVDKDPGLEYVTYEDGFAVIANYERFKGSRKADVEAHGGAALEETVVPVIILTLKPKEQQMFFVESAVSCSPKNGATIKLFANPPLKKPRIVVNGQSYDGSFDGDKHNVVFNMPELRRKGHYDADIYDSGIKKTTLPFETKRQTGTNQLI